MLDPAEQQHLLATLAWWRMAGVDVVLDATAIDWTARPGDAPGQSFDWPEKAAGAGGASAGQPAPASPTQRGPLPGAPVLPRPAPPIAQSSASRPPLQVPPPASQRPSPPAPPARPQGQASPTPAARDFPSTPPDAATMAARTAAAKAPSLEALETTLRAFDGCGLKATAKNLCFYRGTPNARVMLIGEAPGRDEDLDGRPFVGPSGLLLDKMLASIGLTEADVHITNTVYWRPPGNRPPTPQETLVCRPFLERQIELVAPKLIVTLGGPAAKAVLGIDDGILKIRGKWRELLVGSANVRVMPTLHPAYLLRTPAAKRQAWRDLLAVKSELAK